VDASPFTVAQLPFMHEHVSVSGERELSRRQDALDYQLNWNDRWDSASRCGLIGLTTGRCTVRQRMIFPLQLSRRPVGPQRIENK